MHMTQAEDIVVEDVRQSWPEMSREEALAHARNVVNPDTLDGEPGDESFDAYTLVLSETG